MTAREVSAKALIEIFDNGVFSDTALKSLSGPLDQRDRAFAAALTFGVLERAVTLDHIIDCTGSRPAAKLDSEVRQVLRCGLYQLLYMSSVPDNSAVSESVNTVRSLGFQGASGYVNGLLRSFIRTGKSIPIHKDPMTALSIETGVPKELVGMLRRSLGHDTAISYLKACEQPAPTYIRVNTLRTTPQKLSGILRSEGAAVSEAEGNENALILEYKGDITSLRSFEDGLFHVQDLSSQQCARFLCASPGMRVLDVCAAPGGKTMTIAEQMNDKGEIVACDISGERLIKAAESAQRLGITSASFKVLDGSADNDSLGMFDRILCDVVCSGFGVIRRKPEIRYKKLSDVSALPEQQFNILESASRHLKKDGLLVYSTCTLNPKENKDVTDRFVGEHPEFTYDTQPVTTVTSESYGGDGFYMARLVRR